jgi:hypothetical protein
MPKLRNAIRLAWIWTTALCLLVQGVGTAAGGVLCLGCDNAPGAWSSVAVTTAPCTPKNDCCDGHGPGGGPASHPDPDDGDGGDPGCGCIDVTLPAADGMPGHRPVAFTLCLLHVAVAAPVLVAGSDVPAAWPLWSARAGPSIRLLLPSARQTVLNI